MNYKLADLITLLGCEVKGDLSLENISGLAPFFQAQEDSLTFASDEKFLKNLTRNKSKSYNSSRYSFTRKYRKDIFKS